MGQRGPAPESKALAKLKGNRNVPAERRAVDVGEGMAISAIAAPERLSPEARRIWDEVVATQAVLAKEGIAWISVADAHHLEYLCERGAAWHYARSALAMAVEKSKREASKTAIAAIVEMFSGRKSKKGQKKAEREAAQQAAAEESGLVTEEGQIAALVRIEMQAGAAYEKSLEKAALTPRMRQIVKAMRLIGTRREVVEDEPEIIELDGQDQLLCSGS